MSNKVKAERRCGFVIVTTRSGAEFTLNEDTAEDLRLALERLDIRDHVEEILNAHPDYFDFTGSTTRDELIETVVNLALDFTDFSHGTACSETLEDTVYEQAEFLGVMA